MKALRQLLQYIVHRCADEQARAPCSCIAITDNLSELASALFRGRACSACLADAPSWADRCVDFGLWTATNCGTFGELGGVCRKDVSCCHLSGSRLPRRLQAVLCISSLGGASILIPALSARLATLTLPLHGAHGSQQPACLFTDSPLLLWLHLLQLFAALHQCYYICNCGLRLAGD